jgi:Predicted transcriptional regulator
MGNSRWDADSLAEEVSCSRRTIYRILQTLDTAGVPWHSDPTTRSYRVRFGYKFAELEQAFPIPRDS